MDIEGYIVCVNENCCVLKYCTSTIDISTIIIIPKSQLIHYLDLCPYNCRLFTKDEVNDYIQKAYIDCPRRSTKIKVEHTVISLP